MSDTASGFARGRGPTPSPVLLLGATGRTGSRALREFLDRGVPVRVIVRSASRLPSDAVGNPLLTVTEAEVLAMPTADLVTALDGCGAVVSCLGHSISVRGVLGPPRHLVEEAVRRVCTSVRASQPDRAVRLVLMSSVSVNRPGHADARRGALERLVLAVMRAVLPPARDNQRAADLLVRRVGREDPFLRWVVVRPDTLHDADTAGYETSDQLTASLFRPDVTARSNVAAFMADLVCDPSLWNRWAGQLPVVTDASSDPTPPGTATRSVPQPAPGRAAQT